MLGGALLHAVERNEPGNEFADFGGRLLHNGKVARQFLRNCSSRRFDDALRLSATHSSIRSWRPLHLGVVFSSGRDRYKPLGRRSCSLVREY